MHPFIQHKLEGLSCTWHCCRHPMKVARGGLGGEKVSLIQGLSLLGPRLWKRLRRAFLGVSCPEVEQVHLIRGQQGTAPGDRGLVMAMTTDCCLNSNQQPVAMATMLLVRSLIPVICSPRSYLTPVSAVSLHVSPKSSILGALKVGARKGNSSWWQQYTWGDN